LYFEVVGIETYLGHKLYSTNPDTGQGLHPATSVYLFAGLPPTIHILTIETGTTLATMFWAEKEVITNLTQTKT